MKLGREADFPEGEFKARPSLAFVHPIRYARGSFQALCSYHGLPREDKGS